ncbi:MAG TPA: phenylalanine--tRNA ligase subunit beta [Miltoncostaeaceae bacterium]|nr:phenylalanine--tRNA ligase subunit beta [Miltoncostaeaceae bacterium]
MRVPLSWLRDVVDPGLPAEELARSLSGSGTLVEAIHRTGVPDTNGNLGSFRVGRVLSAEQHPNADRLRVCSVDLGDLAPARIVCGAPNVAAGQTVAVALPGALLPGAEKPLGVAKLRGVESRGMILSARELGLGDDHSGIMELAEGPAPGTPLAEVLPLAETVLELEITSNRPDCLALYGVAREVHAVTGAPLAPLDESDPPAEGDGDVRDHASVEVRAPDLCPRYMARVFLDVRVGPSPGWLARRLEAAGMRAINNVVDVTNYVMLLTGQPLHAFDLDRLAGRAVVARRAGDGERIVTLDGQERVLDASMLAIADAERPAVIAGIFGAEFAEVHDGTTRVLLEAASFDGPTILDTSLRLGLRSESSGRFEKGLPRELPARGMSVASRMLVELVGAAMVPGTIDVGEPAPPRAPVRMRHARVPRILGVEVPAEESEAILGRLGLGVTPDGDGLIAEIPYERASDLTREIDLIEEVGRIRGLGDIPALLPRLAGTGRLTPAQQLERRLTRLCADLGLSEAITYRQVPEADLDLMRIADDDPRRGLVRMDHPMSAEMAVMRRSMLPGLLRAAARNQAHQIADGGLFEIGRTYAPREDGLADERPFLAAVRWGRERTEGWRADPRPVDVWAATGLATALARAAGVRTETRANAAPYFHPVRQARLVAGDAVVGWAAEMHPLVLRAFDVAAPVAAVVLDLEALLAARGSPAQYEDLLTVPMSTRDLALVVAETVPAADLVAAARQAGAPLVRDVRVFDRYAGAQVEPGHVSLALRLSLADPGRTLTDDEIDAVVARVRDALAGRGARLRG